MSITLVVASFTLPNGDFAHSAEIVICDNFEITVSIHLTLYASICIENGFFLLKISHLTIL